MTGFIEIAIAMFFFMLCRYFFSNTRLPWRNMIFEYVSIVTIVWLINSMVQFIGQF